MLTHAGVTPLLPALATLIALADPTPTAGGGADRLRAEGVEVNQGLGAERSRILNRRWLHWVRHHRPWVTLKAAVSLDGRVATREGESKWITGEAARERGLELREEHDAILVGVETILADDPQLTRRLGLNPISGWRRIVLDTRLRTPTDAVVVRTRPEATVIAHTAEAGIEDRRRLRHPRHHPGAHRGGRRSARGLQRGQGGQEVIGRGPCCWAVTPG